MQKCIMFLFYTLMCRNYQEYKRKPCWSRIGTFQKSVHQQFLEIVSLTLEDCCDPLYLWVINLLKDEQDLSLGMLIRCKRIYNFWCSMVVLHQFLYVFMCTLYNIMIFIWTNLLMVAKVHNVLVLHFYVYELSRIQKETFLESNWDFPEICPPIVFRDR